MRATVLLVPLLFGISVAASAQDFFQACQATSSYDLTLAPNTMIFDRPQPWPHRIELGDGSMLVEGHPQRLNDEDQDRINVFQRQLRALVPRIKGIAQQGVDLAVQEVRDEAAGLQLDPDTMQQLNQRLSADAAELHQRIAQSHSTHDWRGDSANQYANKILSDIAPLIAGAIGQQAMNAAMNGDMQRAGELRDQATDLAGNFRPRLQRRLQVLQPAVSAICPELQRLSQLQEGLHTDDGHPLNLIQVGQ